MDTVSRDFNIDPVEVDAGNIAWANRPRLFWADWEFLEEANVTWSTTKGGARRKATLQPEALPPCSHWLDKGCVFEGETALARLPTFTRAVRKTRPPRRPAGLDRLRPHEKLLWELDHFAQPAYQYQDCHCVRDASGSLRQPSANEREVLMGFSAGLHLGSSGFFAILIRQGER